MVQAREVSRWIRELAKVTWVAVCSGNHDNAGRQISLDRAPISQWLVALGREPKIITDGVTQVVNDLIVTTVPYHCSKEQKIGMAESRSHYPTATRGSLARTPSHSAKSVSGVYRRGSRSRRTSPNLPTGIFHFRAQPSVSVLRGKQLGAKDWQSECTGAWTAFERPFPEPYRFGYGVRAGELGNVESAVAF